MMKYFIFLTFFAYTLFASTQLDSIGFQDRQKTVLLSLEKDPELIVQQLPNMYGTSLSKNVQTVTFEIENLTSVDMTDVVFSIKLFDQHKNVIIDKIKGMDKKKLFISFSKMNILKNSQKERLDIVLKNEQNSWKFSQDVLLNKGVLRVYFPDMDLYDSVQLNIDDMEPRILKKEYDVFLIPVFSNRRYSFKVLKSHSEKPLYFEIDKRYLFSSNNEISQIREVFDFKVTKVKNRSKEMYRLSFKIPELIDVDSQTLTKVDMHYGDAGIFGDNVGIYFDSDAYEIFLEKKELIIKTLKKTADYVRVTLRENGFEFYSFIISPTIKRTHAYPDRNKSRDDYLMATSGVQIYDELGKNVLYHVDREHIIRPVKSSSKWVIFKSEVSSKNLRAKKDELYSVLGENRLFIEGLTRRVSKIHVLPGGKHVSNISSDSMISGYIRDDGWIEYINTLWWIHASDIELELNFLMRPNYVVRTSPSGPKVYISEKYTQIRGHYVSEKWIKISGVYDETGYQKSENELYIHSDGVMMLSESREL